MDPERRYWHTEIGCNHRMANLVAAFGLAQIERWDELIAGRQRVSALYDKFLQSLPLRRRPVASWAGEAVWLYTVATDRRDALLSSCRRCGVDARAVWPALPENRAFRKFAPAWCPRASEIANTAVWLPTWSGMPRQAVEAVAAAVSRAFAPAGGI
jgi:perosamine synthetase